MMELWNKISYVIQLWGACVVFLLPANKRGNSVYRMAGVGAALVLLSYVMNSWFSVPEDIGLVLGYWGFYIVLGICGVYLCLEGSFIQALYCTMFAAGMQHIAYDIYMIYDALGGENPLVVVLVYGAVYVVFYYFMARRLTDQGEFAVNRQSIIPIVTMIMLVWTFNILEESSVLVFQADTGHRLLYRLIDGTCCFYVLWVQINQKERLSLQRELDGINAAWRQQKKQYEVTRETIDTINRKCHDLRHQIRALRAMEDSKDREEYFNEVENAIMIYDTALETGNRALDTVLMEKGLFCQSHGIQWSCMADGSRLDFMRLEDIYAIFGNALDNAITAVMELRDVQKRIISVRILNQNRIMVIQVQNYYLGELQFENGLPVTTKKNRRDHGYGMKSIRYTAEKYNGTITVRTDNGIFMLQVLIPIAG